MIRLYSVAKASRALPVRLSKQNKTHCGNCLIIAGSPGKWGAGIFTAEAAYRVGAGYVSVYDPKKKFPIAKHPDFLTIHKISHFSEYACVALGPGLDSSTRIIRIIRQLIREKVTAVVLDAEAINCLAKQRKIIQLPSTWILTPPEGELARLLQVTSYKIRKNRLKAVQQAQKKMGCIVVLKGAPTFIATEKTVWQSVTGNSSLAKAGTGDVLTGMIAGFLSQKIDSVEAACLATCLHGMMADSWIKEGNDHLSLMASDLLKRIPRTLKSIRE